MKHLRLTALVGAATFLGTTASSFAQTALPPAPAKTDKAPTLTRAIKIENLPSALVAYWLDPKHNARPIALGEVNPNRLGAPTAAEEQGAFSLPGDIEQIVSIDAQNVVLVAGGSDEDIRRLQELIDVLDQPLRQVEMEAQFVEVNGADLSQFGVDFSGKGNADSAGAYQIGFVRNNFTAKLNKLVAEGSAKIVSAPRVTAINNVPATIRATPSPDRAPTWAYNATPTINGDDTITILLQSKIPPVEGQRSLTTIVNLRDGDTIALLLGTLPPSGARMTAQTSVVFFTARIIRRAADKKPAN